LNVLLVGRRADELKWKLDLNPLVGRSSTEEGVSPLLEVTADSAVSEIAVTPVVPGGAVVAMGGLFVPPGDSGSSRGGSTFTCPS